MERPAALRGRHRTETRGLSGRPLRDRATEIVRYLYQGMGGRLPIVGVGGVFTADDAFAKLAAGASLVQVYTGCIYEGPALAHHINRGLVQVMDRHGFTAITDVIGSAVQST